MNTLGEDYWIGLTGVSLDELVWMDNSPVNYITASGIRSGDRSGCFRIDISDDYEWDDTACDSEIRSICEREMSKSN